MKLLITLVCAVFAAFGQDAGLTGEWSGIFQQGPIYVILKQDGNKLSGSGGPTQKQQLLDFKDGSIDGAHVVFSAGPMRFDLQVTGDTLRGEMTNKGDTSKVYLKRVGANNGTEPAFEVASVKPSPPSPDGRISSQMKMDPGRITLTNVTLKRIIVSAYDMKEHQILGPDWIENQRYDIVATMQRDSTGDEVLRMLRKLLGERFHLTFRRESRELPVYALVIAKTGHKLKEVDFGKSSSSLQPGKLDAHGVPMENFTSMLSRMIDRPVIDQTNLKGFFDFKLEWTPDDPAAASRPGEPGAIVDSAVGPNLVVALQQQLGLKVEPRKAPVEVLVIDRVEKIPTEN